ncbi:hypothetical protein [Aestuariimicrobium kwangyangense]|uniref:hypothetical protein n=1 Tax=Aestuariimicrobium kwangyangense TaxID=396389 RepID=UPI00047DBB8B|nr:hypothetical protein [Aestuariimicrobium kwangyangense]
MPAPYGYGATPYQAQPAGPTPRGNVPLVLVGSAFVVSVLLSVWGAAAAVNYVTLSNSEGDAAAAESSYALELGGSVLLQLVPIVVGIVGLVLGIRAMRHPQTKTKGLIAVVGAIVAPIVSLVVFFAGVAGAVG